MGFIENERRKKERKENQRDKERSDALNFQHRIAALLEEEEMKQRQRETSQKEAARVAKIRSQEQFEQSGLRKMIDELDESGSHVHHSLGEGGSVDILVSFSKVPLLQVEIKKRIKIQTSPDGTLEIKAGLCGSTTIPKRIWDGEKGQEILERALEKGYKRPKRALAVRGISSGDISSSAGDSHGEQN